METERAMARTTPRYVPKAEFDSLFNTVCNWGRWGPDDERGTLNYVGPEQVRRADGLVSSARSVSMAVPINKTAGPDNPRPAAHYYMVQDFNVLSDLGEPVTAQNSSALEKGRLTDRGECSPLVRPFFDHLYLLFHLCDPHGHVLLGATTPPCAHLFAALQLARA